MFCGGVTFIDEHERKAVKIGQNRKKRKREQMKKKMFLKTECQNCQKTANSIFILYTYYDEICCESK